MSEEGAEEMEPFTMITKEEVGTAGLLGTIRNGKTWIQVARQATVCYMYVIYQCMLWIDVHVSNVTCQYTDLLTACRPFRMMV